ncbi:LysR substrate-binding domain-containing protein [Gordonia sputi]
MDDWTTLLAPQLSALVALLTHDGHMTSAAADLGIPQSSMSRRIHGLQATLKVPLVVADGRNVRLTPAARRLASQTRGPLEALNRTLAELTDEVDPDRGTVRFGFPLTMGTGHMPDLLAQFRRQYPGIHVVLKQAHGSELTADLRSGALDLAVVIPASDDVDHRIIGYQGIYVTVADTHALAGRVNLHIEDLAGETFIANPRSYHLRRITEEWCRKAGFTPRISIEVTEFATIRELVARRLGIALLPHDERAPSGLAEVTLAGDEHRRSVALARAASFQSAPTARLHDYLLRNFDS